MVAINHREGGGLKQAEVRVTGQPSLLGDL